MDRDEALKLLKGGPEGIAEWNRRRAAGEVIPDLSGAHLDGAHLDGAHLDGAHLDGADLTMAHLRMTHLGGADLRKAHLGGADLTSAYLDEAHLDWADLSGANLEFTLLGEADLNGASCSMSKFIDVDLSRVKGLDSIVHRGPSTIGTDTLVQSRGKIPEVFLRGCGVPDALIADLPSLIGAMKPIQFYSCFVSYSTKDEEFASRLHKDFRDAGIKCWKWDHDARTGRTIWGEIDQAIRQYDKLVLVASKASLTSPAVNREIERAIQQEDDRKKLKQQGKYEGDWNVLFPVRLDNFIFQKWDHERKADVVSKVIADARKWNTDPSVYPKVRDRLLRDLKAEDSTAK